MSSVCHACLEDLTDDPPPYHAACLRALFDTPELPPIDIDPANLHLLGQAMAGKTTISGVMAKVSLGWDRRTLRVASEFGRYILKPQGKEFPELPENEHVTMLLARNAGLETPEFALVTLRDGQRAFIVRRFDRTRDGRRLPQEDFCQLAELMPADKYRGSGELLARLIQRHSAEPGLDLARLYRQCLFAWWTGNGDMHLKNVSLLTREPRKPALSPAYDLVNTEIVIPGDTPALPICGRRAKLKAKDWMTFGTYCGLSARLVADEWSRLVESMSPASRVLERSFLSAELREKYVEGLEKRAKILREAA